MSDAPLQEGSHGLPAWPPGPYAATRHAVSDLRLFLVSTRTPGLRVAYPLVGAAGALQAASETDPYGRLRRTATSVIRILGGLPDCEQYFTKVPTTLDHEWSRVCSTPFRWHRRSSGEKRT